MTLISYYVLGLMDELRVDDSVGGTPQIIWIKDGVDEPMEWTEDSVKIEIEKLKNGKSLSSRLWNIFPKQREDNTV